MSTWLEYGRAVLDSCLEGRAGVELQAAEARLRTSLAEASVFSAVCASARLPPEESQVLALLVAVEASLPCQAAVGVLQDDPSRRRLSLGLLADLLPPPHPGPLALADSGRLRGAALVHVDRAGPWAAREIWAAASLVWALHGETGLDPELPPDVCVLRSAAAADHAGASRLHLVSGADRVSRRQAAARQLPGCGVLVTPPPETDLEWDALLREATLGALAVLVEVERVPVGLGRAVRRTEHVTWCLSSDTELPLADLPDLPRRDLLVTDGTATHEEWVALTGGPPPTGARLDRYQLQQVALADAAPEEAVRRLVGGVLDRVAGRVRPRRGWADLVLPDALQAQVRGLVARHRQRHVIYDEWGFPGLPSRGTTALFSGPSGTGKTLTAEVVAHELGLDLFVLDLSNLMSKYLGETEKNLSALFDAAETGDVVLFFDEADALFGKRSAVSDAKDRYANVEVAYLLQRLERHDGLVLLATNLPNNIDEAFLRRLHAQLEFTAPGPQERAGIWQRAFPAGCPTKDLDLDLLARVVDLPGGSITTAAVAAAFAAAAAQEPVTMERVAAAVTAEYRKLGRLSSPEDLTP